MQRDVACLQVGLKSSFQDGQVLRHTCITLTHIAPQAKASMTAHGLQELMVCLVKPLISACLPEADW
jgi:hypothetical protein